MTTRLPAGSDLWLLFYDRETDGYVPKCVGRITRVDARRGYLVDGQWREAAYPHFGSEREALVHIAAHPFKVPTIK